jgi:hypothetical protein
VQSDGHGLPSLAFASSCPRVSDVRLLHEWTKLTAPRRRRPPVAVMHALPKPKKDRRRDRSQYGGRWLTERWRSWRLMLEPLHRRRCAFGHLSVVALLSIAAEPPSSRHVGIPHLH